MQLLEHELKFRLAAHRTGLIRRWLESACDADPLFPADEVSTIYFDTPGFDFLREKTDGHTYKRKVRMRWYGAGELTFLEIKYRLGAARDKLRIESPASSRSVVRRHLEDGSLTTLLEPLRMSGGQLPATLMPVLTIAFQRSRYVDRASGSRIAVDEQIRVPAVNRRYFPGVRPDPLPFAVVEVKGPSTRLPPGLSAILDLGGSRASISKYSECCRRLTGSNP
jgi:hypothetical protein